MEGVVNQARLVGSPAEYDSLYPARGRSLGMANRWVFTYYRPRLPRVHRTDEQKRPRLVEAVLEAVSCFERAGIDNVFAVRGHDTDVIRPTMATFSTARLPATA